MAGTSASPRAVILCALEFERRSFRRAGLARLFDLECCGPGASGIESWARQAGNSAHAADRRIVLAGLAGAIAPEVAAGTCWIARQVVNSHGTDRWTPTWSGPWGSHLARGCTIASAPVTLPHATAKLALRERSGADLVDQESVAFARVASRAGWQWAVIRGVSDDLNATLPPGLDRWVDDLGRTRVMAAALSLSLRPILAPTLLKLAVNSTRALRAVAGVLRAIASISQGSLR